MSITDLHVELLPARTVLSVFAKGGDGGWGGDGGKGGLGVSTASGNVNFGHDLTATAATDASGGDGGDANGGYADAGAAGRDLISAMVPEKK